MQRGYTENSGSVAVVQLPIPRPIPRMAAPAQPLTQDELEMQRLIEQVLGNQPLTYGDLAGPSGPVPSTSAPNVSAPRHVGYSKKERMLRRVEEEEGRNALLQAQNIPTTSADLKPVLGVPPGFQSSMSPFSAFGYFPPFGAAAPQMPMANPAQEAAVKRMQRQTADQEKKNKRRRLLEGPSASRPLALPIATPLPPSLPTLPMASHPRSSSSEESTHSGEEAGPVMLDGAPLTGLPPAKALGRKKRLLRNRVSAQQAREKKKQLLAQLEAKVADLESRNASLDEEANALVQQNEELRKRVRENIHKPAQNR